MLWELRQEELRQEAEERARREAEQARLDEERRIAEEKQRAEDRAFLVLQLTELDEFQKALERNLQQRLNRKGGGRR